MKLSITDFPTMLYAETYGYYAGLTDTYSCKTEQGWYLKVSFTRNSAVGYYRDKLTKNGKEYSYAYVSVTSPSGRCFQRGYCFSGNQTEDLKALSEKFFTEYELWPEGLYKSEVSWGRIKEG